MPVLEVSNGQALSPTFDATVGVLVCDAHARTARPLDFLDEDGWRPIEAAFRALGAGELRRNATRLAWRPPGAAVEALLRPIG